MTKDGFVFLAMGFTGTYSAPTVPVRQTTCAT
jgi:hypothetical protein